MTSKQEINLQRVRQKIADIRTLLDNVMYYSEPLSELEHKKIREAYNLICLANDKL